MKAAAAALALVLALPAVAAEREEVCARQHNENDFSHRAYRVEAIVTDGSDLNSATNSYKYRYYKNYVVIFWARGEATIIEMDFLPPGVLFSYGRDQQGRRWSVSTGTIVCF